MRQGFKAVMPLWIAAAPVALAYVIAARNAELSAVEIQMMSLTLYSAAAQIATVQLFAGEVPALTIFFTVLVMNIHHIIYGLSLSKHINFNPVEKAVAAYGLTDAAYGITIAMKGNRSLQFLLGAEISLFVAWNGMTALALMIGDIFAIFDRLPLDVVVPLTFFILLMTMIETSTDLSIVLFSTLFATLLIIIGLGQITVIVVSIGSSLFGVAMTQFHGMKATFSR